MKLKSQSLWILVLALGWLFDFLFWKHTPGISFAIYAVVTLFAGIAVLWKDGIRPARRTWWLVPVFLFFAVMSFVRMEPLSTFLAHAFTLALMVLFTVTYQGGRWLDYSLADYFSRMFDLGGSLFARPLMFWGATKKAASEASAGQPPVAKRASQFWPILRGLLFAIPVVAFFASLLASADPVFSARLQDFLDLLRIENLPEYIFRTVYILIIAYVLAGVYLHAAERSTDEKLLGAEQPFISPFFGFTEASVVMGSVILLFVSFVLIQFQYFFGGQANINLEGYTYSEYARRGFGELVTVAFFSLVLFLGLSVVVRRESGTQKKVFSGMGVALLLLVGVMLVSAYQRLVLYETAYGFTRLRTYTHVFIIWLALLLAASVVLDFLNKQRAFALVAIVAALGFGASLLVMNVDGFIVHQNIERARQGEDLDVGYLASLSDDMVPLLVGEYQSAAADSSIRERLGAALTCIDAHNSASNDRLDTSFQAFHLSRFQAERYLASVRSSLSGFAVNESYSQVTTPMQSTYDCYSYNYD